MPNHEMVKSTTDMEGVERYILCIRGQKVILANDLAKLYGIDTKRLNEQVKRNKKRFPADFMFQLTKQEKAEVVANCDHLSKLKFSRTNPYSFTEHGVIMTANLINSKRAVEISILVVRAFVKLRQMLATHTELRQKLNELEQKINTHDDTIICNTSTHGTKYIKKISHNRFCTMALTNPDIV